MSAEIEAIAKSWMAHQGYTSEEITEAETATHQDSGCLREDFGWDCFTEQVDSLHPVWDDLCVAVEMAHIALSALDRLRVRGDER